MANDKDVEKLDLASLRKRIDELDHQIVELLNQRAEVVVAVGKAKRSDGTAIYAPDREQKVLQRLQEMNRGPLPQKTLQAIYRELMSGSFALEKPLRIGFLGPEGSFSHMAASRKFGSSVDYLPLPDFRAIFDEVARGHCDLGGRADREQSRRRSYRDDGLLRGFERSYLCRGRAGSSSQPVGQLSAG